MGSTRAIVLACGVALVGCTKLVGIDKDYSLAGDASVSGGSGGKAGSGGAISGGSGGVGGSVGGKGGTGGAGGSGGTSGGAGGTTGGAGGASGGSGGTSGAAGASGGTTGGTGGLAGSGGASGGTGGTQCPTLAPLGTFPSPGAAVFDDFNRPDGPLGGNWLEDFQNALITSNTLGFTPNADVELLYPQELCPDQEAFMTLAVSDKLSPYMVLQLKMQGGYDCDQIEVVYDASALTLNVGLCDSVGGWTQAGNETPLVLVAGDVLGARARSNGVIEVYKNGNLVGTFDASSWPLNGKSGYPGLEAQSTGALTLDDFGGAG